jgi:hypothetical protein
MYYTEYSIVDELKEWTGKEAYLKYNERLSTGIIGLTHIWFEGKRIDGVIKVSSIGYFNLECDLIEIEINNITQIETEINRIFKL